MTSTILQDDLKEQTDNLQGAHWQPRLAVVVYGQEEGGLVDAVFDSVARHLKNDRMRIAGAIQRNSDDGDRSRCSMRLWDLASDTETEISEFRGAHSRGCRLDPQAFEGVVGRVEASIGAATDLVIINRFGKQEAEGRGFRPAISLALEHDVPVLTAVNSANLGAWRNFAEGCGQVLPLSTTSILDFARSCHGAKFDDVRTDV